jgi:hypothetical protein
MAEQVDDFFDDSAHLLFISGLSRKKRKLEPSVDREVPDDSQEDNVAGFALSPHLLAEVENGVG